VSVLALTDPVPGAGRAFEWVLALSDLTASGKDGVSTDKVALYANMLAGEFPPAAFTMDALRAVTEDNGKGFFPPVDAVRHRLRDFLARRRTEAAHGPSLGHLTASDAHWVRVLREMLEGYRDGPLRLWLHFVEMNHPQAFATILTEFGQARLASVLGTSAIAEPAASPDVSRAVSQVAGRFASQAAKSARVFAPKPPERSIEEQLAALKSGVSR
jgi:hypothetical protein